MQRFLTPALLMLASYGASAADTPNTAPPPAPSLSDQEGQEEIEPEVNIIQRKDKTIEEYRVNGRLYMIKIIPKHAPPYYLLDKDGDGSMESWRPELETDIQIPHWVLFRW